MGRETDRSLAFYRLLMRGYPRRFRAIYEDAIVDAFASERELVYLRRSLRAVVAFWAFMLSDAVAGVVATRARDAWRRIAHGARLIRGSTGFTAALATLAIVPIWAWSRFVSRADGDAGGATIVFCVSATQAFVTWAFARLAIAWLSARRNRAPRVRSKKYASVRRARLVARMAKTSAVTFVVAAAVEGRRAHLHDVVSVAVSPVYWLLLAATLAAVLAVYFCADGWLRVRDAP